MWIGSMSVAASCRNKDTGMLSKDAMKRRIDAATVANMDAKLAYISFLSGIDFLKFDLDAPMAAVKTNASRSMTELFTARGERGTS